MTKWKLITQQNKLQAQLHLAVLPTVIHKVFFTTPMFPRYHIAKEIKESTRELCNHTSYVQHGIRFPSKSPLLLAYMKVRWHSPCCINVSLNTSFLTILGFTFGRLCSEMWFISDFQNTFWRLTSRYIDLSLSTSIPTTAQNLIYHRFFVGSQIVFRCSFKRYLKSFLGCPTLFNENCSQT
jgi:hypothetical protein